MKIDFHTHGRLAKRLPFSEIYTEWLFEQARAAGLDALCLTEHFNTVQFGEIYRYLFSVGRMEGDSIVLENGLRIFPGMETDIAEGGHILTIGCAQENSRNSTNAWSPTKKRDPSCPFEELMELFSDYQVLVGGAHPYRAGGHIPELPQESIRQLDFFDMNGKDVALDRERTETLTKALGEKYQIPIIAGSDTHQALQYGCIFTEMWYDVDTISKLYGEIRRRNYHIVVSDQAREKVESAALLKRNLKGIHAEGGNYVAALFEELRGKVTERAREL